MSGYSRCRSEDYIKVAVQGVDNRECGKRKAREWHRGQAENVLEATGGFEPPIGVLQTPALTTWLRRQIQDFGAEEEIRTPTALRPQRPQRCVSTNSTTSASAPSESAENERVSGCRLSSPIIIAKATKIVHFCARKSGKNTRATGQQHVRLAYGFKQFV